MIISVRCVGNAHDFDLELAPEDFPQIAGYEFIEGAVCSVCAARMKIAIARVLAVAAGIEASVDLASVVAVADNPATPIPIEDRTP